MRLGTTRPAGRHGFTLIEMLVVLVLVSTLATLIILAVPSSSDRRAVRGADQLQGWLLVAKQKALRDRAPRGIRLIQDAANPGFVRELQYIEQPDNYVFTLDDSRPAGAPATLPLQPTPTLYVPVRAAAAPMKADPPAPYSNPRLTPTVFWFAYIPTDCEASVRAGDRLEILDSTDPPHRIVAVQYLPAGSFYSPWTNANITGYTLLSLASPVTVANKPYIAPDAVGTVQTTDPQPREPSNAENFSTTTILARNPQIWYTANWRILRQPLPMLGEPPLQMPKDIAVDISTDSVISPAFVAANPLFGANLPQDPDNVNVIDILFTPKGSLLHSPNGDRVFLWVRDTKKPIALADQTIAAVIAGGGALDQLGEMVTVSISSRTGQISAAPIATTGADPFFFARNDRSGGL